MPDSCNEVNIKHICGNGRVEEGETCDIKTGSCYTCTTDWWLCDSSACESTCGDGQITGGEVCDDGNTQREDGCSSTCLEFEDKFTCYNQGDDNVPDHIQFYEAQTVCERVVENEE